MKHGRWAMTAAIALAPIASFANRADAKDDLNLQRVLLSSGGVGYFEYETSLDGSRDVSLDVPLDQVDDVLKSIVVYDDSGNLGSITLPGKELLEEAFRGLPFTPETLESPASLLSALRGADVHVESVGHTITGQILSVTEEQEKLPTGDLVTRHRLTLLSDGSLQQVIVEEIQKLEVLDKALRDQLAEALRALGDQRERAARQIVVHMDGTGTRTVRVAYVASVPLWKSTYRMILPSDDSKKTVDLEGFAVVENRSGQAWNNVELTLAAGNPVTLRQAIYDAYYVNRPMVPVEVLGRVLPRPDEGGIPVGFGVGKGPMPPSLDHGGNLAPEAVPVAPPSATAMPAAPPSAAPFLPAQASEQATQVVFHLPTPVSIRDGQSALLPVSNETLPAERVSLYQPEVERRHPLSSVKLTNNGETDMPPGIVAIYTHSDGRGGPSYAGDATLSLLPAGASRFMSYAVDLRVTVDQEEQSSQPLTIAKIVDGMLVLTRTERHATAYTIGGAKEEDRVVILEHPRIPGFEPEASRDFEIVEASATNYRLRREVPKGATVKLTFVLARPLVEQVAISDLPSDRLGAYASASELPAAVREVLVRVADRKAKVAEKEAALGELTAERAHIVEEQGRIREDLKAVPKESDLHKRYLGELSDQEDQLKALDSKITTAKAAVADARKALTDLIRSVQI